MPLVYQQSTVFKKYIRDVAYICGDHGQPQITRFPLDQVLMKNDVVVLTAQILVDALTKGQVFLKNIGLIVFDECHETKVIVLPLLLQCKFSALEYHLLSLSLYLPYRWTLAIML